MGPQERRPFSEKCHPGLFAFHNLRCCFNEISKEFQESTGIKTSLIMNVDSASAASTEMYLPCSIAAAISKPRARNLGKKTVSVFLSHNSNHRVSSFEGISDELRNFIQKT